MFEENFENRDGERSTMKSYEYLERARIAHAEGEESLAASLDLAAFDCAQREDVGPLDDFVEGLKQAWFIAAIQKRRTLAEHVFELMEPFLTSEEVERYALRLQDLAMDKLEEYGVDRGELEEILDAVPQEIANMRAMKAETPVPFNMPFFGLDFVPILPSADEVKRMVEENAAAFERSMGQEHDCQCHEADNGDDAECPECDCDGACDCHEEKDEQAVEPKKTAPAGGPQINLMAFNGAQNVPPFLNHLLQGAGNAMAGFSFPPMGQQRPAIEEDRLTYDDMAGFERVIEKMQAFGIGVDRDPEFKEFIALLNEKHGLHGMPICDTLIFRSPAREDASHFMDATFGELGTPGLRVHVEEGSQGNLVLCVFAQTRQGLRLNAAKNEIEGQGVLVLEDIDLWGHLLAQEEGCKGCGQGNEQHSNKGVREAIRLIRSAVENPEVYVLASCSADGAIDGFLLDLLDPFTMVDIEYPTEAERASQWKALMVEHPSLAEADLDTLVAYSKGLPRFDIYMAAREAIDTCYKASLVSRVYEPVHTGLICEKLAAYQPLESDEYKNLENKAVEDFRHELDDLDALLSFEGAQNVADLLGEDFDELEPGESAPE